MEVRRDDKINCKCFEINQKVIFCVCEGRQNCFMSSVVKQAEICIFGQSGWSKENLPQSRLHSSSKNQPQNTFTPRETSQQCHDGFTTHVQSLFRDVMESASRDIFQFKSCHSLPSSPQMNDVEECHCHQLFF